MATTTNFGWETPDDTDLVKDGAAAMRTLGNSIDTSFVDLKGGTTGQILSKASNTDLDYTWIAANPGDITEVAAGTGISGGGTSGSVTITNSMATAIDAKGDLIAGTGADTFSRLAVGTNGQALLADSSTATGLKWGSVASAKSFSLLGTGTLTGAATITVSGISGMDNLFVVVYGAGSVNASSYFMVRINGDTGSNYDLYGGTVEGKATYNSGITSGYNGTNNSAITLARGSGSANSVCHGTLMIMGCNSSGKKVYFGAGGANQQSASDGSTNFTIGGIWDSTATISSISLVSSSGNFDEGSFEVWGAA